MAMLPAQVVSARSECLRAAPTSFHPSFRSDFTADSAAVPLEFARIVVLGSERFLGESLRRVVQASWPRSAVAAVYSAAAVRETLDGGHADLLITDIVAADGETLERLPQWTGPEGNVRRAFIVTRHCEPGVLQALTQLRVQGAFDSGSCGPDELSSAFTELAENRSYWSASMIAVLMQERMSSSSVFRMLTNTERMVLGIIGDGTDDKAAARQLVLAVSTIRSVRESLHRKFGIQQKSELMACAERAGFVIRTSHGIVRPDLWRLRQAHFSGVGGRTRNTLVRQVA